MKKSLMMMMNQSFEELGYGYLYNWYAANDVNFSPIDWALPILSDYSTLITTLGGTSVAGGKMKEAGLNHWNTPNTGADNSSGFTGWGSGSRDSAGTFLSFSEILALGMTHISAAKALTYDSAAFSNTGITQKYGISIRLLYTGGGSPSTITDNDGNIYDVILIGSQRWTVQNWKCTTLDNGDPIPNVTSDSAWAALTTLGRCAYDNNPNNV